MAVFSKSRQLGLNWCSGPRLRLLLSILSMMLIQCYNVMHVSSWNCGMGLSVEPYRSPYFFLYLSRQDNFVFLQADFQFVVNLII